MLSGIAGDFSQVQKEEGLLTLANEIHPGE